MTELIKTWALGICAVSLFSGFVLAALGESRLKNALKLVAAAAVAAVIFSPFLPGTGRAYLAGAQALSPDISRAQGEFEDIKREAERMCARRIEEYVASLASAQGVECRCRAVCSYEEGMFFLESCTLCFGGDLSADQKQVFISRAAQGIGVEEAYISEGWF